ncbi:membrane hypothetical protein [uncultured Desulfobacterium sp.]|uniref:Methyltransferase domain-containing protein n=1 Tax=uncultured Desulfobacterium sp. TaxID=201089 RepID=A0A445MZC2_9BACT|nr:membrane hypothetical protein [uncultured Desulfobacterium sp.]
MQLIKTILLLLAILIPAIAGAIITSVLYFLFFAPISIITLGFGLAVNSITVCYSMTYLQFLSRPNELSAKDSLREARAIGMPAIVTTILTSLAMLFSGISVFEHLGMVAAVSVMASLVFMHTFSPAILTAISPGKSTYLPLKHIISRLSRTGKKGAFVGSAFGIIMLYFAMPGLVISLTLLKMLILVGAVTTVLMFLFFLDWKLTLSCLVPVLFTLICMLSTLVLSVSHLDISSLMLIVILVVIGAGYSLYFVRSRQRYGDWAHASFELVKTAVFLSCAFAIIVFLALCFAEYPSLKSAGLIASVGICSILIGNFVIIPPIVDYLFQRRAEDLKKYPTEPHALVLRRYRNMEPYPRLFALFKLRLDPMFSELGGLLESWSGVNSILDIGTGYGVPAAWCLERFKDARIYGIEPDGERVRVASAAVGNRGHIVQGMAPEIPEAPEPADAALMLDMMHYLSDEQLELALKGIRSTLRKNGRLVIKVAVPYQRTPSCLWRFENFRLRLFRIPVYYRLPETIGKALNMAGFEIEIAAQSRFNAELFWFVAKAVHETRKSR